MDNEIFVVSFFRKMVRIGRNVKCVVSRGCKVKEELFFFSEEESEEEEGFEEDEEEEDDEEEMGIFVFIKGGRLIIRGWIVIRVRG